MHGGSHIQFGLAQDANPERRMGIQAALQSKFLISIKGARMPANLVYRFDYIARGATTSLFIHGYSENEAVNYSAVVGFPRGLYGKTPRDRAQINLTQGETFLHVDRTVARKVYIHNLSGINPCAVDILQIVESF
jgi:hypothetical protein